MVIYGGHFENFETLNAASICSDMKKSSQIMPNKLFYDDVIDDVTGWPQKFVFMFMFRNGWPQEQIARAMSRQ